MVNFNQKLHGLLKLWCDSDTF